MALRFIQFVTNKAFMALRFIQFVYSENSVQITTIKQGLGYSIHLEWISVFQMEKEEEGKGQMLDLTGRLEDSYILGALISRGSFSTVNKCLYKGKKERACKVYKKIHLEGRKVAAHVHTLLSLRHPHMVSVHDVFETEQELQVVVDLAMGEELLERIERSDHYSERDASQAIHTILSVLQYLHSQKLPHGAVYPENLLYESEAPKAKLKLSEIAMPKLIQSSTTFPIYMAPSFDPKPPTTATKCSADMWSLGILIYIMLFGTEPTMEEIHSLHVEVCDGSCCDISASACSLVKGLLQDDPSLRLTAAEAQQHPWLCGSTVPTKHMTDAQERLKTFNARRKLRATTHAIIATQRAMSLINLKNCQATR